MRKFALLLISLLIVSGVMAEVDYTPTNTGVKERNNRFVTSISVNEDVFSLTADQRNSAYVDATASKTFVVEPGKPVSLKMYSDGENNGWMNAYVYIDTDMNGFDAGIADDGYTPTGDLVSYSFYNNGADSDENGWNSQGTALTGDYRSTLDLPDFIAPETTGTYRIRFKYDWCNINPDGGEGTYFNNTFMGHGGTIIDFTLNVETYENNSSTIEVAPATGTLYRWENNADKIAEGEWSYKWVSRTMAPQITITSEKERHENNIRQNGSALEFYGGNKDNNNTYGNETFNISVAGNYVITGYGFEYQKASSDTYTATIKIGEESIPVGTEKASFQKENVNSQTASFTIEEENKGIILSNFYINVKQKEIPSGIEIKATTGTFTESNENKTYHSKWESDEYLGLTLSTSANNMSTSGDYITGASGLSYESTYTITAPQGMVVAAYSFDFVNTESGYSETLTVNGQTYTSSTDVQHISVEIDNPESFATFTQTGNNKAIKFTNFFVTLKKDPRVTAPATEVFTTRSGDIPYRIPAIAQASNGNLIAVADYRHSREDIGVVNNGRIDLHGRISTNNGADWGSTFTIVEGKGADSPDFMHVGFGDPCIVADRESDRVLMLSCAGNVSFPNGTHDKHQNIARFYSEDNGETWSEPVDIAEAIYSMWDNSNNHGPVEAMFIGSGKIHQSRYVKTGSYYRLYCAVLLRNREKTKTNFVLYSDDFGGSWNVLGGVETAPIPNDADEPKVEELPNGNIIISSRCNGGRHFNIFTFTDAEKAEGSWGTHATSNSGNSGVAATGNSCNGEILIVPAQHKEEGRNVWIALQSVPFGDGRKNVGIYYKVLDSAEEYSTPADFAKDWDGRLQVSNIGSAYSTMSLLNDGTIAFLYEESTYAADYTIQHKNITLENITNGKYSYFVSKYKITYILDGEEYQTAEYAEGEKISGIDAPQKEGYTFTWNNIPAHMPAEDITVEGIYTVNTYAVTYMVDGEVYRTDSVAYGSDITLAEAPEKEGHTFDGWSEIPETMPANDITVEGTFTVNTYAVTYMVDGEVYKTDSIAYGSDITLAEVPEKEGHTFNWNEHPATMPANDITVEGGYTTNIYAVTYMVDGEVYKTDSVAYGSVITLAEAPEKEGHTFDGWSEIPETMPANDITVEGTFTANTYAVTYMVDGEVYKTDSVAYGSDITLAEAPEKEGYTFSGWSETPETMPANDFTVEGTFTVNTYAVTYMVDGEVYKTDSVAYGSVITLAEAPEKEGHTFDGWSEIPETMPANDITVEGTFTINSYTVTFVVDGETYTTSSVEYGAEITVPDMEEKEGHTFNWNEHPATMPANDITVEGGYTTNIYAVTYMVDGEVYKTDSVAYGSVITLAEAPEKEGHTFNGWSEIPETMPANDITVEGTFTVNRYRITYMVDDTPYFTLRIKYGEKITPLQEPQKDGYTFSGWSEIPETMPAEDIVITGHFTSEDGETTSAKLITDNKNDIVIYNIKGERILNTENLERGLYIINGKTVYVK